MGFWVRLREWLRGGSRSTFGSRKVISSPARGARRPGSASGATPQVGAPGSDPGAFVKLADRYLGMNMADTAFQICQRGLDANPGHEAGRVLMVRILSAKGMDAEARALIASLRTELGDSSRLKDLEVGLERAQLASRRAEGNASSSPSPDARPDPTRAEIQALEGYLARIRAQRARLAIH